MNGHRWGHANRREHVEEVHAGRLRKIPKAQASQGRSGKVPESSGKPRQVVRACS